MLTENTNITYTIHIQTERERYISIWTEREIEIDIDREGDIDLYRWRGRCVLLGWRPQRGCRRRETKL